MSKHILYSIAVAMSISLVTLLFIQGVWIRNAFKLSEVNFKSDVSEAANEFVLQLEKNEINAQFKAHNRRTSILNMIDSLNRSIEKLQIQNPDVRFEESMQDISGDEVKKEISGIILDYDTPRAYWQTPEPVEGTFPNCYSRDSLVSYEGKPCNSCPFNELGSKTGDTLAKACKEQVAIYLLRPDNIMPIIVRIPATSKFIFQKYMARLISNMIPFYGVVTRITLEKATSKGGQPYAQFSFEAVNLLSKEEADSARNFGQKFAEMVNTAYEMEVKAAV